MIRACPGLQECYHGSDPVFFTEFYGNTMEDSDGIGLSDGSGTCDVT
jgi:hypothetical protein